MSKRQRKNFPVAIVGMHGRFPDAYDAKDFWTNLYEGNNTIGLIPKERWDWEKLFGSSANESESTTINCAAFMPMADCFDARFFGIMPREAEAMDPQQRLFMQTAYAALEDAGYAPSSLSGSNTGVFVGIGNADYPGMMRRDGAVFDIYRATGLALTCISNRVSFSLNIHGPSEVIDTACSGSLVAMHRAIQAMRCGECDLAVVGGVNLLAGPDLFIAFDKADMLSKSARCRTFDAQANGYVRGEGVAALVLCPLDVAEKNGDYIYAVVQGSAVNHGGRAHSFTAPNAAAQAQVVKTAWQNSGKNFHDAFMIETHGTGTPLGDPIEINGLKKVSEEFGFNSTEETRSSIALGALKSHVGHMEATAGVGGVIKAVLSMKYRVIPKNLNFAELNPHIDLENSPYYVPIQNVELTPRDGSAELLAGVSSFGFGGVNGHVVLESRNAIEPSLKKRISHKIPSIPYLIPLSGKDKNGLHSRVHQLIHFLEVSCNKYDEKAEYTSVMAALCSSLKVKADPDVAQEITLASIKVSPLQWMGALKNLESLLGRAVDASEVLDCISLQDSARKIVRNTQIHNIVKASDQASLCSRIALPEAEIRAAGLNQIAYSLMQGRDNFKERLACVVHSKEELLSLLQAYIKAPDASHTWLWTYTIRMDDPQMNQPAALETHTNIETLATWAVWWVRAKSAILEWEVLYPKAAKPRKFPLPAYPFQLDRIWYKAAAMESRAAPEPKIQQPPHPRKVIAPSILPGSREPVFLPSSITAAWDACMQQSQLLIPSSVMSLAYLLDYAVYKNQGMPVELENVIFGRPCNMQDEQLAFCYSPDSGSGVIQCLTSNEHKVLSQALVKNHVEPIPKLNELDFVSGAPLSTAQFLAQLEKADLSLGKVLHCVNRLHAGNNKLKIELQLPPWKAKAGQFWVPLMAGMLSGLAYLQQNKPLQLPWTIRSVAFNPALSQSIETLYLAMDGSSFSVIAVDRASNPVLKLNGIVLRETPAVKLSSTFRTTSANQLEASAA